MSEKNQTNQNETIETLMDLYEKKNRELEEREMEARYRLQLLENTMPALMMWNIWRLMLSTQSGVNVYSNAPALNAPFSMFSAEYSKEIDADLLEANNREEDLVSKMRQLEDKLDTQNKVLANCRLTEDSLRSKLQEMESYLTGEAALPESTDEQIAIAKAFDKLSQMANERMKMDQRVKDLELRERLLKETLEQADHFIAQMDAQFQSCQRGKSGETSVPISDPPVGKVESIEKAEPIKNEKPIGKTAPIEKAATIENGESTIISLKAKLSNLEEDVEKLRTVFTENAAEKQKLNGSELEQCIAEIRSLAVLLIEERNRLGAIEKKPVTVEKKRVKSEKPSMESSAVQTQKSEKQTLTKVDSQDQTEPMTAPMVESMTKPMAYGGRDILVQDQPTSLLGALSAVSTVHIFVYLFMAFLVLRRNAG